MPQMPRINGVRSPALEAGSVDHEESNRQDQSIYQSEQPVNHINYKGATTSRVIGKVSPWQSTGRKIATLRHSGFGYQESPNRILHPGEPGWIPGYQESPNRIIHPGEPRRSLSATH